MLTLDQRVVIIKGRYKGQTGITKPAPNHRNDSLRVVELDHPVDGTIGVYITTEDEIQQLSHINETKKETKMDTNKNSKSIIETTKKISNIAAIIAVFVVAFVLAAYKILKTENLFEYDLRLRDWSKKTVSKLDALIKLIR